MCVAPLSVDCAPTEVRLGALVQDAVYVAYFAPFSFEMHQDLVARCQLDERVSLQLLGETLDGHDIDMLRIGAPEAVTACNAVLFPAVLFRPYLEGLQPLQNEACGSLCSVTAPQQTLPRHGYAT